MNTEIKLTGDIYAKNPEEFKQYKMLALKEGYTSKELTSHPENKVTGMGQYLSLGETRMQRKGKCGYCNSLISNYGIFGHDRKCEVCGEVIYKKYIKGDLISFIFRGSKNEWLNDEITLRVHDVNMDNCVIHFELAIPKRGRYSRNQSHKNVLKMLDEHKDSWTYYENDKGKRFYSFYNRINGCMNEQTKINICESRRHDGGGGSGFQKCSVVKVFDGKEYSDWASFNGMFPELPMPESFHLYRDWKIEKTIGLILSRAGLTSRPEYFSGRGPGDITKEHLHKIYNMLLEYKGHTAAANFIQMVKGIKTLTGTGFIKSILKLDKNKYVWEDEFNPIETPKDDNIAFDENNIYQQMATMVSIIGSGKMQNLYKVIGIQGDYQTESIIGNFLNEIEDAK